MIVRAFAPTWRRKYSIPLVRTAPTRVCKRSGDCNRAMRDRVVGVLLRRDRDIYTDYNGCHPRAGVWEDPSDGFRAMLRQHARRDRELGDHQDLRR
jgi:hypothetical protein